MKKKKKNNPIVSLIIPVFNSEKYIERCLKSILEGGNEADFEVILVDNGSTDGSMGILREYEEKYSEIVQVKKCETKGAAAVRNFGIKLAIGKYVWFIDADDEIRQGAIDLLVEAAEKNGADLVMFSAEKRFPDGRRVLLRAVDVGDSDWKHRFVRYGMGPWQVLIRREWMLGNGLLFKEGIIHEDMEMMSAMVLFTDKMATVDRVLYDYWQNEDSVLHKKKWDMHYFDIFAALEGLYGRFESAGAVSEYRDDLEYFFVWNLLIDSARDFRKFKEGRVGFRRSRKMMKKNFSGWWRNRYVREKGVGFLVRAWVGMWK